MRGDPGYDGAYTPIVRRYLLTLEANHRWCFTVHIICKDGTTIQCRDFRATDSGVLFFQSTPGRREEEEEDEEEEAESASGFVPITELKFVLPDEMVGPGTAGRAGVPERRQEMPPGAQRQTGMAQQQQMGGQPGTQPHRGPGGQ